jgi:hypothetical protein
MMERHRLLPTLLPLLILVVIARTAAAFVAPSRTARVTSAVYRSVVSTLQEEKDKDSSSVEFIDPETQCHVVLLGCFHGTESSARDVERVVTPDTNVVALELCAARFTDLQREIPPEGTIQQPWIFAYSQMIVKTIQKKGLPTGLAAAVLGGFSGLQTALSGFTPGLEFSTALERATLYNCDIILADQAVDETLRQVGSLPKISLDMLFKSDSPLEELQLHQSTLKRAVLGDEDDDSEIPQVRLGSFLTRNPAAMKDLVRLTIPPTLLFAGFVQVMSTMSASGSGTEWIVDYSDMSLLEALPHWCASVAILTLGHVTLALPAIRVILTERDEILTEGIREACVRAGPGGRVVAVLGLLHVNGIAKRMMEKTKP